MPVDGFFNSALWVSLEITTRLMHHVVTQKAIFLVPFPMFFSTAAFSETAILLPFSPLTTIFYSTLMIISHPHHLVTCCHIVSRC